MSARTLLRTTFFATTLVFSLACAGMMDAMAPEPPVPAPAGSTTTGVNTAINNGVGTTTMDYSTEEKPGDVAKHYKKALTDDGWEVVAAKTGDGGVVTGTKDQESFVVTIEKGEFTTVWTTQ